MSITKCTYVHSKISLLRLCVCHTVGISAASGIDAMRHKRDILFLVAARLFWRRVATRRIPASPLHGHIIRFDRDSSRPKGHSLAFDCPQAALSNLGADGGGLQSKHSCFRVV